MGWLLEYERYLGVILTEHHLDYFIAVEETELLQRFFEVVHLTKNLGRDTCVLKVEAIIECMLCVVCL